MKKLNLKAIAVAMAAALTLGLAGCSSNGNSSTADSSVTAGDRTHELSLRQSLRQSS